LLKLNVIADSSIKKIPAQPEMICPDEISRLVDECKRNYLLKIFVELGFNASGRLSDPNK